MSDWINVRVTLGSYDVVHPSHKQTQVYVQIPEVGRASWLLDASFYVALRNEPWPHVIDEAHNDYMCRGVVSDSTSAAARQAIVAWLLLSEGADYDARYDAVQAAWEADQARQHPVARKLLAENEKLRAQVAGLNESVETTAERMRADAARIAELEAERAKYVGAEPTIAEEMAYLSRCIDSVLELCDKAEQQAERWETPLPVPEWVARVREAADGLVERASYPPALPWAALMDDEDRTEFLDELADSATVNASSAVRLAEIERTCATYRLIAEAQHGHNTAVGPDAVTQVFAPVASLREASSREEPHDSPLRRDYRVGHDLPEPGDPDDRLLSGDELRRAVRGHLFGGGS